MNEKSLFGGEPYLQVPPTLACAIGLNEAIVAQHIEWLCNLPKSGKEIDGHKWIFNTYEQWKEDWFPWWSADTIKRIIQSLELRGIVVSCQPDKGMSRKKYYRISTSAYQHLTFERYHQGKLHRPSGQNAPLEQGNVHPSITVMTEQQSHSIKKRSVKRYMKRKSKYDASHVVIPTEAEEIEATKVRFKELRQSLNNQ